MQVSSPKVESIRPTQLWASLTLRGIFTEGWTVSVRLLLTCRSFAIVSNLENPTRGKIRYLIHSQMVLGQQHTLARSKVNLLLSQKEITTRWPNLQRYGLTTAIVNPNNFSPLTRSRRNRHITPHN